MYGLISFDLYIYLANHHFNYDHKHICHLEKFPYGFLLASFPPLIIHFLLLCISNNFLEADARLLLSFPLGYS